MAEITGRIVGAYREEGFILDNNGNPVTLVDILNMLFDGEGGNGIYGGSGNSPAGTVATALGNFTMRNLDTGELVFEVIGEGDNEGRKTVYTIGRDGIEIRTDGIDDTSYTQIINDKNRIYLKSTNEDTNFTLEVTGRSMRMLTLPEYANDAAADADASLQTKSIYKITGDRALYQKP